MKETIIAMLEKMENDVDYTFLENEKLLDITIDDFEGFDENWEEVFRECDEEAIDNLIEWLEENCISTYGTYYTYYEFEDFTVQLGYSSYDI